MKANQLWTRLWLDRSITTPLHHPREFYIPLALPKRDQKLVGTPLLWAHEANREVCVASLDEKGKETWAFSIADWLENCRNLAGREPQPPSYANTRFRMNWLPHRLQTAAFHTFLNPGRATSPQLERAGGIEALASALKMINPATALSPFVAPPWPAEKRAALVVSMNIDTPYLFKGGPNLLREKWEQIGVKAAWYFLTGQYRLDHPFIDDLQHSGHEVGWHGHRGDHRLSFLKGSALSSRLSHANYFWERYDVKGMRAENFLWSRELFRHARRQMRYDASMRDCFPFVERGETTGTSVPFQTKDRIWEIPTTVTSDYHLPLQWSTENRLALLIEQIDRRIALGGVVHFAYRPDPTASLTSANQELLDGLIEYLGTRMSDLWACVPLEAYQYLSYIQRLSVPSARPDPSLGHSPPPKIANIEL